MDTTKYIKTFAKIDLLLLIIYFMTSFTLESSLPPLLQDYLQSEFERELTTTEDLIYLIAMTLCVIHIVALFGFIFIKTWAKNAFL